MGLPSKKKMNMSPTSSSIQPGKEEEIRGGNPNADQRFYLMVNNLLVDFCLSTMEPYNIPFFFRWLLGQTENLPEDTIHCMLDAVATKLGKAQPRFKQTCKAHLRHFHAKVRLDQYDISGKIMTPEDFEARKKLQEEVNNLKNNTGNEVSKDDLVAGMFDRDRPPEADKEDSTERL